MNHCWGALMTSWKESFRNIPRAIEAELEKITSQNVQVLAGKKVNFEAVRAGTYEHLGLDASSLKVGHRWELIPAIEVGKTSARNQEGWEIVRDRKSTRLNSSH